LDDPNSPIAGMPVLECWKGETTIVLKRSMASGYAGVGNPLFVLDNTRMLFGDAKESIQAVLKALPAKFSWMTKKPCRNLNNSARFIIGSLRR
jgi:hypothetical protein